MAEVEYAIENGVARVVVDRPQLHNAFNDDIIRDLTAAFRELEGRPDVRAVVLASKGPSFCAGADIHWMKKMVGYSFDENLADAATMADMLRTIRDCPRPVIARVHGAAFGGGVGLVAACDMAVALHSATFCLSEVKLGIVPAVISPYVLEKIGHGAARRYALTAERFDAAEALRIGLIHHVVEAAEQLDPWIEAVCRAVRGNGPVAVAVCKKLLGQVQHADRDSAHLMTTRCIAERRVSDEGQEGLTAFLEKRQPRWREGV